VKSISNQFLSLRFLPRLVFNAMSDTEAAASLFGTADSPSDLFTALGTESSQEASDGLFDGASADKLGATDAFYNVPKQRASTHEFSESNQPPIVESRTHAPTHDESAPHGTYSSYQYWNGNQTNYGAGAGTSSKILFFHIYPDSSISLQTAFLMIPTNMQRLPFMTHMSFLKTMLTFLRQYANLLSPKQQIYPLILGTKHLHMIAAM